MQFGAPSGNLLRAFGPVITTSIGIAENHAQALKKAGHPIPPPVICNLLIDTGAFSTLVKHEIAENAGLKLINSNVPIRGVGVDSSGRTYLGAINFSVKSRKVPEATHTIAVNAQISSGNLEFSSNIDGLIGRDVLQYFDFFYEGHTGKFSLQFFKPPGQNSTGGSPP